MLRLSGIEPTIRIRKFPFCLFYIFRALHFFAIGRCFHRLIKLLTIWPLDPVRWKDDKAGNVVSTFAGKEPQNKVNLKLYQVPQNKVQS